MNNLLSKMLGCALVSNIVASAICICPDRKRFTKNHTVSLTFHDVRDDVLKEGDRDIYAIQTKKFSTVL